MLRLFANPACYELWKISFSLASRVTKRQVRTSLLGSSAGPHRPHISAGHLSTGIPVWKDALQPESDDPNEMHTLDLDKWKSVMKARAAPEERRQSDEDEEASAEGEHLQEQGVVSKDISSLEATRDLVAMWQQAGKTVPQEMTDEEVQTLSELTTKSSRRKYLKYLAIREGHKRARKEKQLQKKTAREASMEQSRGQDGDAEEERGPDLKNHLIMHFWDRSMDKLHAWRTAQAMVFGQPLVFDMSYDSNMAKRELENTVSQLMEVEGWNRRATDPYHLHFCNLQEDGAYKKELIKRYGTEAWDRLLVTSTDQQHVEQFPRERLVYLTADSPNVLRTYDHSKVYIIGALVDRSIQSGLSLANAKRLNLATARLPLDEFLHWEVGAKNLTLDQMIRIMLTFKETGKWEEALMFVPKRKYDGFHQQRTKKDGANHRGKGVSYHRPDGGRPLRSEERYSERKFKFEGQTLPRPYQESGISGSDRSAGRPHDRGNKPAATRIRTSLKSTMGEKKGAGKGTVWWDDE
ncbi:tRNA methyltransferase 10 homolog C [Pungitius pungitius]|uniref:tRNA methyltransferase 10 homolog C n=1 Tax=Pungitius pungitius TaxID=134920 RepID=UPI002E105F7F